MTILREHDFSDPNGLADVLATAVAERLSNAATQNGQALLAVSGGRSPVALFERLARKPIDWNRVIITQVDERWVPQDDPASNSRLIRDHLLQGPASAARFLSLKNDAVTAAEGQPACEAMLGALPLPFDVILLGMGDDGHTASLFPGAPELDHALTTDALSAATTATVPPYPRMTLTLAGLLRSRLLVLQLGGEAKQAVYRKALAEGPVEEMPVRAVLRQERVPVEVWLS
jgi:6-phosphogluconolactonase